jgi:hypothetical protein
VLFSLQAGIVVGIFITLLAIVTLAVSILMPLHSPPTVHETMVLTEAEQKIAESQSAEGLYKKLLNTYVQIHGAGRGRYDLESKINTYIKRGLSREEAIIKVAKKEGYNV